MMQSVTTRCFLSVRSVRVKTTTEPKRYVAELVARGTSTVLYTSKACDSESDARTLAGKYLKRNPHYVLTVAAMVKSAPGPGDLQHLRDLVRETYPKYALAEGLDNRDDNLNRFGGIVTDDYCLTAITNTPKERPQADRAVGALRKHLESLGYQFQLVQHHVWGPIHRVSGWPKRG